MTAGLRLGSYETAHGPELTIRRGPADAPQLLLVQPLFEEANFTRSFASDLLRALGDGIGTWLFDLPAQGDSIVPLAAIRLVDWRAAVRAVQAHVAAETGHAPHVAAVRGGALLVEEARSLWRLNACDGAAVLRPLVRAGRHGDSAGIGGWAISPAFEEDLHAATLPCPTCPVSDQEWPGTPPWRRAEPGRDPAVAQTLAADLARWIATCDAR
ncbi:hypothetical protein [Sphingomonas jatrophae]|uniref:Dienelactone hydrolase n=1 Tax=Sphingomonas jatrophae TaxID=1166337 RepID=A0A1I6JWV9_9SPHN|nr:hypothetical protein [Sphingomonas jatrophae]SFR83484.1 hypothetical protein SAMN05192580_1015 [Sphingomonas jatrophae]